jgi:hypothetical protein
MQMPCEGHLMKAKKVRVCLLIRGETFQSILKGKVTMCIKFTTKMHLYDFLHINLNILVNSCFSTDHLWMFPCKHLNINVCNYADLQMIKWSYELNNSNSFICLFVLPIIFNHKSETQLLLWVKFSKNMKLWRPTPVFIHRICN